MDWVSMAGTKTIAVTEAVWERLKELMKREHAGSMNEVVSKLVEKAARVPSSRFGAHKRLKIVLTQEEHEEITADAH
jgi:predicted CopG family antitoxin